MAPTSVAQQPAGETLMTPGQVAAMFGVRPRAVASWADAKRLTVVRTLGGHRRYVEAEIRELRAQQKVSATEAAVA